MNGKKPDFELQPAPRPKPRLTDDEVRSVTQAASRSGFDRSLAPPARMAASTALGGAHARAEARHSAGPPTTPSVSERHPDFNEHPDEALLKLKIPSALSLALKHEAIRRKVTQRFLVLEALAAAGYAFNFSTIPEDGRRLR